jgi:RHS repeat-associated protein
MKIKPTLTSLAVALAAIVQPVLAGFTQDANGNPTHYNGIPIPPMQTVAEARAATEKRLAAIKAEEAQQAAQAAIELATRDSSPATAPQELFFTGKPYLEETGQYLFLFRHYDPELARWTTADPSGFPDGANNLAYVNNCPVSAMDSLALSIHRVYNSFYQSESWTETLYPDFSWSWPPGVSFVWRNSSGTTTNFWGAHQSDYTLPSGAHWITGEIVYQTTDSGPVYGDYNNIPYSTRTVDRVVQFNWYADYRLE